MKRNRLGFLSLLALLGILGLAVRNPSLLGFFGFAYYLRYFFVTPDELFRQNVMWAASIGFFSGLAATGIAVALRVAAPALIAGGTALAAGFVVSVVCFTFALLVLEAKEKQGC